MVMGELVQETEVLVIGGGPGGYSAAFRAADLGLDVTLVDPGDRPGGACLFRGCIPSKTLLYLSELIRDAGRAKSMGITFEKPKIDLEQLRTWKEKVIDNLSAGLMTLSNRRDIQMIKGRAEFETSSSVRIQDSDVRHIKFRHAILSSGSYATPFPGTDLKKGGRVMNSTGALELADIPQSLLILGGGYVGLELGSVYAALGSRVHLVERGDRLLSGVDADLVKPLFKRLEDIFESIELNTTISTLKEDESRVTVEYEGEKEKTRQTFDRVLIAIGRKPKVEGLGLENTKLKMDSHGFVTIDEQQRTGDERIFAVGDVVGGVMLAHKAIREGKVAAEVIAGEPSAFDARAIPAVVYTDPQIAWCGLTEEQARKQNRSVSVQRFPWKFSGRAMTMDATEGLTKMIVDPESGRILGIGITGRDAEGLISEGVLAIEMAALAQDVALSIHPHPTLSETAGEAAEIFLGTATHVLPKKKS